MAKWGKRRTRTSPPAAALPSTTNNISASSSPYFLPDLIPLVASRLTTLEDFFALRAACRAYRARLPLSSSNLASQGPLLLVHHKASTSEALFHVPLRRILRFRLPCARRSPILACLRWLFPTRFAPGDPSPTSFHSFGCRVAIQDASRPELRIRHLLTGKRAVARLPGPPEEYDAVIFSGDLIIAFTQWRPDIYYCRTGHAHWRAAWCDGGYQLYSLMSLKGTLYALTYPNYGLATVELDNNSVVLSFLEDKLSAQTVLNCSTLWLAECHGQLLLVVRTSTYHVFRWKSGERKWARTQSLGGCSLFFNLHEFAGCLGPDHPAVRRDCLYFTGWSGNWSEYSLVDGSLHENDVDYPGRAARKHFVPLAWVLPSIC
ncbi:hypothetical protein CFC21_050105 [Triticum aestivum]|uniref:KIB1-4 beta-propeller domain-containing protein n=2 Tax=Triticum aestivum TaxID=4565 RepID=A0A3B6H2M1_WHEAT|nr:uncharacterized protein LOC109746971 [Aegilops tauschii subsp. strangulata]XP_044354139.1 uncharacterized protein LOC123075647 [Triticum aestivum]KAF7040188.1 hypothetical protein CFC21_050105 [Triticum aestivum]